MSGREQQLVLQEVGLGEPSLPCSISPGHPLLLCCFHHRDITMIRAPLVTHPEEKREKRKKDRSPDLQKNNQADGEGVCHMHCENHVASADGGPRCVITPCGWSRNVDKLAAKKFLEGVISRQGRLRVKRVLLELLKGLKSAFSQRGTEPCPGLSEKSSKQRVKQGDFLFPFTEDLSH